MSAPTSVTRLDTILGLLMCVRRDEGKNENAQQLISEASEVVEKLQRELKCTALVSELVTPLRFKDWKSVTELQKQFPAAAKEREIFLREILALICKDGRMWNWGWESAIEWVEHLDADLRPEACEAMYHLIKANHTKKAQVLLLLECVTKLSVGVRDDVRTELEGDGRSIIDSTVEQIKNLDKYGLRDEMIEVAEFFVPTIVCRFDVRNLGDVSLLLKFFRRLYFEAGNYSVYFCFINTLLKLLEENFLLESEQALHLWAHVLPDSYQRRELNERFDKALQKLSVRKIRLLLHYQRYVEHEDKQKIVDLHDQHPYMLFIISEFVSWYFNGDSKRTQNLYAVAEASSKISAEVLKQMHVKMIERQQIHTFEAFYLFNKFKKHHQPLWSLPDCVISLLNCSHQHELQVVNKCVQARLGLLDEGKPCCFTSTRNNEEQLCSAFVDPYTALTTIWLKSHRNAWGKLEAQPAGKDGLVAVGNETRFQWMIKHVDDQHVKIFNQDGNFLTASDPCQEDKTKINVFMMKENSSDKQLWKINNPVKTATPRIARKRTRAEAYSIIEFIKL